MTTTTTRSHKAAFDLHNLDLMLFVSVCVCVWVRVHCSYFARVVFLACFSLCSCSCCCCCKFSLAHTDALPKENENKSENKTRLKAENAIEFGFLLKPCRAVPCRASRCVELQTNRMWLPSAKPRLTSSDSSWAAEQLGQHSHTHTHAASMTSSGTFTRTGLKKVLYNFGSSWKRTHNRQQAYQPDWKTNKKCTGREREIEEEREQHMAKVLKQNE